MAFESFLGSSMHKWIVSQAQPRGAHTRVKMLSTSAKGRPQHKDPREGGCQQLGLDIHGHSRCRQGRC